MKRSYVIKGAKSLKGTVSISGSKNSALPIMAATLLTEEDIILRNIPRLRDVETMIELLKKLGKKITHEKKRLIIRHQKNNLYNAPYDVVKRMRASISVLGPLLAKQKKANISFPGGCVFGPRPINLHIKGLKELGTKIEIHSGNLEATTEGLKGTKINLLGEFGTSVLATDNILSAAIMAEGKTIIENAAKEPETTDLICFLNHIGAKIEGVESSTLKIEGVKKLHGGEYTIIQDRIEAGTFIIFAIITKGKINICYKFFEHLKEVINFVKSIGVNIKIKSNKILVDASNCKLKPFSLTTLPYPNFPTDLQPLFSTLSTLIPGISTITEKIYPNRFSHLDEISRMGANIEIKQNSAIIKGVNYLEGAEVETSDLRGCAALVAAGLAATNTTKIRNIEHGERGYENLIEKLTKLKASINIEKY